ncbi:MAG TPA: DNA-processing protein DprA [Longimicrobiales bacterium]
MSWRRSTDPDFDAAELHALLRLRMLPALPDHRLQEILNQHGRSACAVVRAASAALLGAVAWRALHERPTIERTDRALRMIERLGVTVLTVFDEAYPARLRRLQSYQPTVLFCRGRTELLDAERSIAIIGARNSTEYGDSVAEMFASELAQHAVVIVSGLARGIDSVAHRAALDARGDTVAVLGCGIDVFYPPANARLQQRIAEQGLLISEFAPGQPALPYHFPQRNRIIAMLGRGVLVVEAGSRSGTRRTVDWALDHSVDVLAIPGPIGRNESQGTNEIIQQGGHLVVCVRDILEVLQWPARAVERAAEADDGAAHVADADARAVFAKLDVTALHVDDIARRCGRSTVDTLGLLTQLELAGVVAQHAGKRFARVITPQRRNRPPRTG